MKRNHRGVILALLLLTPCEWDAAAEEHSTKDRSPKRLRINVEKGTELDYRVSRRQNRSGRFEGGEVKEIDYGLRIENVTKDAALEVQLVVERIRFERSGRAPIEFDSAERKAGESVLMQSLREFVDKPIRLVIDARGRVVHMEDFPAPQVPLDRPATKSVGARRVQETAKYRDAFEAFRGSGREAHLQRALSLMLRFVVSPDVVREDVQTIFAAGLHDVPLVTGKDYRLDTPEPASQSRSRRTIHRGPAPIYDSENRESPRSNPFSGGGNRKGRGTFDLRFSGPVAAYWGEAYEFELVQSFGPRDREVSSREPENGLAYFRATDGLLERFAYRRVMENLSPRDSYAMSWKVDIARR